jgi:hypothetical protein
VHVGGIRLRKDVQHAVKGAIRSTTLIKTLTTIRMIPYSDLILNLFNFLLNMSKQVKLRNVKL